MSREAQLFRGQPVDRTEKNICYKIAGSMLSKRSGLIGLGLLSTSTKLISALMECRFKEIVIPEENEEILKAIKEELANWPQAPMAQVIHTRLQSLTNPGSGNWYTDTVEAVSDIHTRLQGVVDFIDIDTCYMWSNEAVWNRFPQLIKHYAAPKAVIHINGIQEAARCKEWCLSDDDCIETIDNLIAKIPKKITSKRLHKYKAKGRNGNLVTMRAICLKIE